jgi:raffinose/stachyose/melibiose transport system permease protein
MPGRLLPRVGRQAVLVGFALVILGPLLLVVLTSFRTNAELYLRPIGLPETVNLEGYARVLASGRMPRYAFNSALVTAVTVVCVLVFGSMASYAVSRLSRRLAATLFAFFVAGLLVAPQVFMIPLVVLVDTIGLLDSLVAVILVSVALQLPIAVLILSGFMRALPGELLEAALVDGGTEWQVYRRIVLPLTGPAMATLGIFSLVITWNDLLLPLLIIRSQSLQTLPLALLRFRGEYITDYPALFAGVVLASLPMLLAYVLLQRRFVEGLTAGAVKG